MKKREFAKEESLALAGVAALLMIFSHCFAEPWQYGGFTGSFFPLTEARVNHIASFGGIWAGIFAFVLGYGLSAALERHEGSAASLCVQWYKKALGVFWPVLTFCLLLGVLSDTHASETYLTGGAVECVWNVLVEGLGLSYIFGTPMFVHEWWFLSTAIVFLFLTPVLAALVKRFGWAATLVLWVAVPRVTGAGFGHPVYGFSVTLLVGILFQRYGVFERAGEVLEKHFAGWKRFLRPIAAIAALFLCYKAYLGGPGSTYDELHAAIVPVIAVLCLREGFLCFPWIRCAFGFLGRHSANIYLIHTVFAARYLHTPLFSTPWFLLTPVLALAVSLCFSLVLEWGKRAWERSTPSLTGGERYPTDSVPVLTWGEDWNNDLSVRYDLPTRCRSELMGIAMLCVVMFHAANMGLPTRWLSFLWAYGFFGVDVFIFLSAMGLALSLGRRKRSLGRFYVRRLVRILPAYWLVAGACGVILLREGQIGAKVLFWTLSTLSLYTGKAELNYFNWYIPALFALYLVTPLCYALLKRVKYRLTVCAVCYAASIVLANSLPYIVDVSSLIYRIPIYLLGIVIGIYIEEERVLTIPKLAFWGAGLVAAPILSRELAQRGIPLPAPFRFALYGVFVCLAASRLLLCLPERGVMGLPRGFLRLVGESSLEIYLLNIAVVLLSGHLTELLPFAPNEVWFHAIVVPGHIVLGIGLHKLLEPAIKRLNK